MDKRNLKILFTIGKKAQEADDRSIMALLGCMVCYEDAVKRRKHRHIRIRYGQSPDAHTDYLKFIFKEHLEFEVPIAAFTSVLAVSMCQNAPRHQGPGINWDRHPGFVMALRDELSRIRISKQYQEKVRLWIEQTAADKGITGLLKKCTIVS